VHKNPIKEVTTRLDTYQGRDKGRRTKKQ